MADRPAAIRPTATASTSLPRGHRSNGFPKEAVGATWSRGDAPVQDRGLAPRPGDPCRPRSHRAACDAKKVSDGGNAPSGGTTRGAEPPEAERDPAIAVAVSSQGHYRYHSTVHSDWRPT